MRIRHLNPPLLCMCRKMETRRPLQIAVTLFGLLDVRKPHQAGKSTHHTMGVCSETRKRKEKFHKYRMSLKKKAEMAKEHQAEIQMVLFRKGVLYDIPGDRREVSSRHKNVPCGL